MRTIRIHARGRVGVVDERLSQSPLPRPHGGHGGRAGGHGGEVGAGINRGAWVDHRAYPSSHYPGHPRVASPMPIKKRARSGLPSPVYLLTP